MKWIFMFCVFLIGNSVFVMHNVVFASESEEIVANSNFIVASSRIIKKEQTLPAYKEIKIAGSFDVFLTEGTPGRVRIEASDNLLPYVVVKVENATLFITMADNIFYTIRNGKGALKVYVPVDRLLKRISVLGSADVFNVGELHFDQLQCSILGSGGVKWETLTTKKLDASVLGSGDIFIRTLSAPSFEAKVSGSGDIRFEDLVAKEGKISVSGSGDIRMGGTIQNLDISISGSGDVDTKKLQAKQVSVFVSGSGAAHVYAEEGISGKAHKGSVSVKGNPKKQALFDRKGRLIKF